VGFHWEQLKSISFRYMWKIISKLLLVLPLFISVHLGPLIDIINHIFEIGSDDYARLGFSQIIRGVLIILMLLSGLYLRHKIKLDSMSKLLLIFSAYIFLFSWVHISPYKDFVFGLKVLFITVVYINSKVLFSSNIIGDKFVKSAYYMIALTVFISLIVGYYMDVPSYEGIDFALAGITGQPAGPSANIASIFPIIFIGNLQNISNWKIINLLFCIILSLAMMRRTGIIAISLSSLFVIILSLSKVKDVLKKLILLFLIIVIVIVGWYFIKKYSFDQAIEMRFEEADIRKGGTGSGRTLFWEESISHILSRDSFIEIFFGEGYEFSRIIMYKSMGTYTMAHNDFIEIWLDFGWIGLIIILIYLYLLIREMFKSKFKLVLIMIIVISISFMLFAGGYFDSTFSSTFMLMGYIKGVNFEKKNGYN